VDRIRQSSLHSKIIFEVCLNGIGGTLEAPTFDKTRNCLYLDRQKQTYIGGELEQYSA
jgi:hypothetical protein